MKRNTSKGRGVSAGPSQRQLRAGELTRHALVDILRGHEIADEALQGKSITITEVRMSPDLKNALCFVEPLGGVQSDAVVKALNVNVKFLRGRLGHSIDMKFTPALKFVHDESFNEATRISRLFEDPKVAQDLRQDDGEA